MQRIIWVLWPSFVVAGIAEALFFTLIDPQELCLFGVPVHFSKLATYSIGFFAFWVVCAASSLFTLFIQRPPSDINRRKTTPPAQRGRGDRAGSGRQR